MVVAREVLLGAVAGTLAHRHGGQIERGGPPFGPPHERLDLFEVEFEPDAPKHARGLGRRHRQVMRAHLDQLAVGPQSSQR